MHIVAPFMLKKYNNSLPALLITLCDKTDCEPTEVHGKKSDGGGEDNGGVTE